MKHLAFSYRCTPVASWLLAALVATLSVSDVMAASKSQPASASQIAIFYGGNQIKSAKLVGEITSEREIIEHKVMTATGLEVVKLLPGRLRIDTVDIAVPDFKPGHPFHDAWVGILGSNLPRETLDIRWLDGSGNTLRRASLPNCWVASFRADDSGETVAKLACESVQFLDK